MSLLEMHNPSDHVYITPLDLDEFKNKEEQTIQTAHGLLQFDPISRQRLSDVIDSMSTTDSIEWGFIDNKCELTKKELTAMLVKAKKDSGAKSAELYKVVREIKDRLNSGVKNNLK